MTASIRYSVSTNFRLSSRYDVKPIFFWLLSREKSGEGSEERCDEGKVIYHVFKMCLIDCPMFLFSPPSPPPPSPASARPDFQTSYWTVHLSPPMPSLLHHVCPSCLSVTSVHYVWPSHLSVTSVRHVCPSCLSVTSVRHFCPSCLSVRSVCHICLSVISVCPSCLSVRHICLSLLHTLENSRTLTNTLEHSPLSLDLLLSVPSWMAQS